MLLLVVLGTAAIFSPTLSQPARSDAFYESEYLLPMYRDRNEWGETLERPYKGVGAGKMPMGGMETKSDLTKEKVLERQTAPARLFRRQFVIDPIGGGYLLRRQSGPQPNVDNLAKKSFPLDPIGGGYLLRRQSGPQPNVDNLAKKSFPLDPIGGGYLLKRAAEDDISLNELYNDLLRIALAADLYRASPFEGKPKRSQTGRIVPKEEILATLATDGSFLNNKNLHLIGKNLESFPIDPIGGGLLLGRSVSINQDKVNSPKANQLPGNNLGH
ncbi:UNVERIFIED_CONTAM: hypothetical protein PYX00_010522 [Menopon gallinae]|uniref:Uncharacterized protein n=1 Tax=Menopon gallinae TaxID=328185 RepID=A0AAW2HFX9_9NEOP